MASKAKLNVQSFPRPPKLERTSRHIRIAFGDQLIADTNEAYWVLETHHPPTYYLPPSSIKVPLKPTRKSTFCEFKGNATYYSIDLSAAASNGQIKVTNVPDRIWSYNSPTPAYTPIKGYYAFYASPWDCFVDGELVTKQPGIFYGGWVTSEIEGVVKGANGNWDPDI